MDPLGTPQQWDAQGNPLQSTPPPSTTSWDAEGNPLPAQGSTVATAAPSLTDNPNGEGIYRMKGPDGKEAGIPYSNAKGPATQAGYKFADDHEYSRFMKDYLADPGEQAKTTELAKQDPSLNLMLGAGREALKTVLGLADASTKATGGGSAGSMVPGVGNNAKPIGAGSVPGVRQFVDEPNQNAWQTAGGVGENVGEFALGDELLKALPELAGSQKLQTVTKIMQIAEKHPIIAAALKQGLIAGGQTFAKTGGDVGAAAGAGATAAGIGAAAGGIADAAGNAIARRATTTAEVGGVETPVSAEARNTATPTPVQAAGQASIKNAAQNALQGHLEELNESRATPAGPKQLPARTGPFEFNLRGVTPVEGTTGNIAHRAAEFDPAASRVPQGGTPGAQNTEQLGSTAATVPDRMLKRTQAYTTSTTGETVPASDRVSEAGGGTLKTQDANIAKAHIKNLNDVIASPDFQKMPPAQQSDLLAARREAQAQMSAYHEQVMQNLPGASRPNLEPVDIPATLRKVGGWTDAANELEHQGRQGFQLLNDVTGDRFNALRQANKDAWDAYTGASGEANQRVAKAALDDSERQMGEMFRGLRGIVNEKELDGFNDAYRNSQGLRRVADAVDSSFQGNLNNSRSSFEYRGFDGNKLLANLSTLQKTMGRGALNRLIGEGNANTLFQVAELNSTIAKRGDFGAAVNAVAKHLPIAHLTLASAGSVAGWRATHTWEGAAAGAVAGGAASMAARKVMNAVLTNPKIAKQLIYGMQYGKPQNYGPFIASMISKQFTDSSLQQQQEQEQPTQ